MYIQLDSGVDPKTDADVYSDAEITSIAGTIPGSVIAQGGVTVNNNATVRNDVIAKGKITLNNDVQVGKVISAGNYIDINNKVRIEVIRLHTALIRTDMQYTWAIILLFIIYTPLRARVR